jgi:urease accessory protein
MLIANRLIPRGRGLAQALVKRAATIELDWDVRQKSRFDAIDSQGRELGVFLPRGSVARGGDVLVAEDGSLIRVTATAQSVLVVRHCKEHGAPFDLLRAAYHLGNRHVQLELTPDHLKLEPDHVLADMLRQMHLIVSEEQLPFEPEAGAYGSSSGHGHGHGHAHGHAHEHGQVHGAGPAHDHNQVEPQVQAHGHSHDHPHDHSHDRAQAHTHDHGHGHAHGPRGDDQSH